MSAQAELLDLSEENPTLLTVRSFRHRLRAVLGSVGMPDRAAQDLMLAFQEHATNTISHGEPKPSVLSLRLLKEGTYWTLKIGDNAGSFDEFDGYMALATWADRRSSIRPTGMGLRFIGTRFPDFTYSPKMDEPSGLNILTLTFPPRAAELLKPFVVVVEDDPVQRMVLKTMLMEEYRVADFGRADQALRVLLNHPADLVFSDIEMPGMDGFTLRRELAKQSRTDTIPFVFLTAHDDDKTADIASDLSIDDFLSKPVSHASLLRIGRRLIRRARTLRDRIAIEGAEEATESLAVQVPSKVGTVELAAASVSATAGGGDVVQTVKFKGQTVVLVADVMGHGLAARFFAHGVAAYFRSVAHSASKASGPDGLMTALSDALFNDPTFERTVVSAQILAIDKDGTIDIASAGHPFPVRIAGGQPEWVEIGGPLLGLAEELTFPLRRVELGKGDRLIAYTDGVTEIGTARRDPNEAARQLFDYVRLLEGVTPAEGLKRLFEQHAKDSGTPPPDDVTALILGR